MTKPVTRAEAHAYGATLAEQVPEYLRPALEVQRLAAAVRAHTLNDLALSPDLAMQATYAAICRASELGFPDDRADRAVGMPTYTERLEQARREDAAAVKAAVPMSYSPRDMLREAEANTRTR